MCLCALCESSLIVNYTILYENDLVFKVTPEGKQVSVIDRQHKLTGNYLMFSNRGKLPDGAKLLDADEIIKLKRCILGAKVTNTLRLIEPRQIFDYGQMYVENILRHDKNARQHFLALISWRGLIFEDISALASGLVARIEQL